jgi:hypothetical protein
MGCCHGHEIIGEWRVIGQYELDVDVFFREGFTELVACYPQTTTVMRR